MFRSSLLMVSVFVAGGYAHEASTVELSTPMHHHTPDVREVLASARGVAPTVCLLAADGVASTGRWGRGGGFWDAPAMSIGGEVRMRVREMLRARLAAEDRRALLDALSADDACVRRLSATIIGRSDDRAFVAPLKARTSAASPGERQSAAIALGLLGARDAVETLLRMLRDPSPDGRADAAWALGRIGDRSAGRYVATPLRDQYPDVRAASMVGLGHLQARDNVDELLRVLREDTSPEVRRVAAWALGQLQSR